MQKSATEQNATAKLNGLFSATYEELRRLAASVRRGSRNATLNPTALVNEAYLKMAVSPPAEAASRLHFKRIAARAMRQVLVEAARRRGALKRGAAYVFVTFDDALQSSTGAGYEDVLALDAVLEDLARMNPRQVEVIECRFFSGLTCAETAEVLEVSESTVLRDWRAARAWLATRLRRSG